MRGPSQHEAVLAHEGRISERFHGFGCDLFFRAGLQDGKVVLKRIFLVLQGDLHFLTGLGFKFSLVILHRSRDHAEGKSTPMLICGKCELQMLPVGLR